MQERFSRGERGTISATKGATSAYNGTVYLGYETPSGFVISQAGGLLQQGIAPISFGHVVLCQSFRCVYELVVGRQRKKKGVFSRERQGSWMSCQKTTEKRGPPTDGNE